jgi:hypothetical protein
MNLSPNLLAPVTGGVGGEGEFREGFAWLDRLARNGLRGRMMLGHGDCS